MLNACNIALPYTSSSVGILASEKLMTNQILISRDSDRRSQKKSIS